MLRALLPAGLLAALLLGGCSSTPDSEKPLALPEIVNPLPVKELWRHSLADAGDFVFQPVVLGNSIFAADHKGWVTRLEFGGDRSDSVKETWRVDVAPRLTGGVAADDRIVVVGTIKGEVFALSAADGKPLWKSALSAEIIAPAAIADGIVVVRSGDNRVYGLDAANGQRKWSYQRPIPSLSIRSTAAPVIAEQLSFVGFPGGKVMALNIKTGVAIWEGTVSLPKGANELERIADVVAPPVLGARELCAVAHQGRLVCFDMSNGNLLWAKDVSSAVGLVLDNKAVYVTDDKGIVHAFDRSSGSSLWKQEKLVNRPVSAPFVRSGQIVVADGSGGVHLLSRDDGALRGRINIGGGLVSAPMQALEAGILIQTRRGALVAISAE